LLSSKLPNISNVLPSNAGSMDVSLNNNQQQMLNDIQSLQNIERDLFNALETNVNLSPDEYKKIIDKINSISQMRVNLYQTFGNFNNLYVNTLVDSQDTIQQQAFAIGIIEKQLNQAKTNLQKLESDKNNKIRLIEINDYYGEKYDEHTLLMKYIIYTLIPIIIITFLFNRGFLPNFIFYFLLIIIAIVGSIFIVRCLLSIWSRDNMNYQEYMWKFNMKNAPTVNSKAANDDPWLSTKFSGFGDFGTCIGSSCCTTGMIYDNNLNQCMPDSSHKSCKNKHSNTTTDSFVVPSNFY
jgi:hypothetical protein